MVVYLNNLATSRPTFVAPVTGADGACLIFELIVGNKAGLRAKDQLIVNVVSHYQPPLAKAIAPGRAGAGDTVALDGTGSTDPGEGIASYQWTQLEGPFVKLSDPLGPVPIFSAPANCTLKFRLRVTNYHGLKSDAVCVVSVL